MLLLCDIDDEDDEDDAVVAILDVSVACSIASPSCKSDCQDEMKVNDVKDKDSMID